jgi:hypothetical protein
MNSFKTQLVTQLCILLTQLGKLNEEVSKKSKESGDEIQLLHKQIESERGK